jgi:hypothetical protein
VVNASYFNPERVLVEGGSLSVMIDVEVDIGMVDVTVLN